jgi:cyclopropane-fatty-acyl-phospholipid synthase
MGGRSRASFTADLAELRSHLQVNDARFWPALLRGSVGLGESYIRGLWETDDLLAVLRAGARELGRFDTARVYLHWPRSMMHRLRRLVPHNSREGARENISAHYDLGNDLFAAFLDSRMQYSCAIFDPGLLGDGEADSPDDEALEQAQLAKLNRICERLELSSDDHLLEIGTGWGGLAVHAAAEFDCRVTTTTISREQAALARERVSMAGLEDRVTVIERDYRDLDGSFDKLVSVEMIEAVGWQYFDTFFRQCAARLRAGGRMLLQAITLPDRLYEAEKATRTFANTHVFPGGCLPSEQVIDSCARRAGLQPLVRERISDSYGPTLAAWRRRFLTAWNRGLGDGYDERFRRLWEFYLAYCEAGFRERRIGDVQVLFEKRAFAGPVA